MLRKGVLISFEGMEGAGKTTQCDLLAQKLRDLGQEVVVVREPGGVDISEQIRDVVLDPKNTKIDTITEVLLFQAARAQLYAELVLPSLKAGKIVLMDRTRDSSTIYQGIVRDIGVKLIETLNDISTRKTYPLVTFLLDLPAPEGMRRRMEKGNLDRIENEGVELQKQVCQGYLDFANQDKQNRWVVLDAGQSVDIVANKVWETVQTKLNLNN